MKTKKSAATEKSSPLVVIPPRPDDLAHMTELLPPVPGKKHPLAAREHPGARTMSGKATRTDIRRETPRISAPRTSGKPPERGGQPRSKKSGK